MKIKEIEKKRYCSPEIRMIKIDYEISLVMASATGGGDPPPGDENSSIQPERIGGNPFKLPTA
ncbi:MAG: hypothetical protein WCP69_05120 [Bacteroidota bacterium]